MRGPELNTNICGDVWFLHAVTAKGSFIIFSERLCLLSGAGTQWDETVNSSAFHILTIIITPLPNKLMTQSFTFHISKETWLHSYSGLLDNYHGVLWYLAISESVTWFWFWSVLLTAEAVELRATSNFTKSTNISLYNDKLGWMYMIFSFLVGHVALNWLSLSTKLHSPLYDEESFQFWSSGPVYSR